MLLKDKVALITGASRGIGKAVAILFARNGARLVVSGSSPERLRSVADEIRAAGARCVEVVGDLSREEMPPELIRRAVDEFGCVDVLVNNAGIMIRTPTADLTPAAWDRMLNINLKSAFLLCQGVLAIMVKAGGGSIVNVASSAAKVPNPNRCVAYSASKAGMVAMTQYIAREYAASGIRVNAVCPGPIETDMTEEWSPEYRTKKIAQIPLGHIGIPDDVAHAVLFLAGPHSAFITGEALNINGGTIMD